VNKATVTSLANMSLLGWLGKNSRSASPIEHRPTRMVLGILGIRSISRFEEVETDWMAPILEAWGTPDAIVCPAEGDSSHAIQTWAHSKKIPVECCTADWIRQGRRAGVLRDSQIQRQATHLLLLQGPRSTKMITLAERLHKKGVPVVISERPGQAVKSPS